LPAERLQTALNAALADNQRTENILRERTSLPDEVLSAKRVRDFHILPTQALQWGLVQSVRDFTLPQGRRLFRFRCGRSMAFSYHPNSELG
jgi:ATP-dependent Clp protease, protease subunit